MKSLQDMGGKLSGLAVPPLGLERALVDPPALTSLSRLIAGGIFSINDLLAAEMALRAIILHDHVHLLSPYYRRQLIQTGKEKPLGWNSGNMSMPGDPSGGKSAPQQHESAGLEFIQNQPYFHAIHLSCDNQLFEATDEYVSAVFETNHKLRMKKEGDETIRIAEISNKTPFVLDFTNNPLIFVCHDRDEFFNDIFYSDGRLIELYLGRILSSGSPFYSGNSETRAALDLRPPAGSFFFSRLEDSWNQMERSWAKLGVHVPIPPLLYIVLSRSSQRSDIPNTIIDLRDEFKDARSNLWNMIESALYESSLDNMERIIADIERSAGSIVPKGLNKHRGINFIRIFSNLIKMILDPTEGLNVTSNVSQISYCDAARILSDHVSELLPPAPILIKHFTESELNRIGITYSALDKSNF